MSTFAIREYYAWFWLVFPGIIDISQMCDLDILPMLIMPS